MFGATLRKSHPTPRRSTCSGSHSPEPKLTVPLLGPLLGKKMTVPFSLSRLWWGLVFVVIQENSQLLKNFAHDAGRCLRFETNPSGPPIQTLVLVGQNDPGDGAGGTEDDLEGIALGPGSDWAEQAKAGFPVVASRAQRQGRAASGLFMAGLRIEGQPHNFPVSGDVGPLYHASLPWAGPESTSGCRFSSVTVASMSTKL